MYTKLEYAETPVLRFKSQNVKTVLSNFYVSGANLPAPDEDLSADYSMKISVGKQISDNVEACPVLCTERQTSSHCHASVVLYPPLNTHTYAHLLHPLHLKTFSSTFV